MMWWNGSGAWVWLMVLPMMAMTWALIALVVIPWAGHGSERPASPLEGLDRRFAAGDIDVEEYRTRRAELTRHS